jgi:hypothetical protein
MAIALDSALAAVQIVPAVIAIAQGKDPTTKGLTGALIALAAWIGLHHYVGFIHDATNRTLYQILAVIAAILGVVVAVRLKQPVLGTLIVTGGALLGLRALDVIG